MSAYRRRDSFLPFSRPSITDAEIAAVTEVLRSGWLATGAKAAAFESQFCEYVGCREAVALTSGTGGMHIALRALGIGPGDEVITPAMTWVSTINLIVLAGAKPVFADVDVDTLMVTPETVQPLITEQTKLIIPVHFAGAPCAPLHGIAGGIPILDDAAHAMGTYLGEDHVGKSGMAIFSFHPIKNLTTGEGGMFVSDNPHLVERIRRLKFHGLGADAYDRTMQGRSPQAQVQEPGYKYNITDIAAALGVVQLRRLDEMNARRAALIDLYMKGLEDVPEIIPLKVPAYPHRHSWHLFIVRLDIRKARMDRDTFMQKLKERNIGSGLHFRAAHLHRYYEQEMGFQRGLLPNTEWNSDRILSLPLFPDMTDADVVDVVAAIKDVLTAS